jgi:hypothetical protein
MRRFGLKREPVPAKRKTGGEVPSRRGCGAEVGARTLAKTGMRRGVGGEQTVGMEEFAEEVARTCGDDVGRRGTGDGALGARRRRVAWATTVVNRLLSEAN